MSRPSDEDGRDDMGSRPVENGVSRIGLLDHLGHGNLGDDATFTAVMQNIRRRRPDAAFVGLCLNPLDTAQRHGVQAYAIRRDSKKPPPSLGIAPPSASQGKLKAGLRRHPLLLGVLRRIKAGVITRPRALLSELVFLVESFRVVRSLDMLVFCGGGQLLDSWGGPWGFPYTLWKWVILGRLARVDCLFLNVGAGPIRHSLSKFFIREALRHARYASFRDESSRVLVRQIGYHGGAEVRPDNVFALDVSGYEMQVNGESRVATVGLSPMVYCDPRVYWEKDQDVYDAFIAKLGAFGVWLLDNRHGVSLFSSDIRIDQTAIDDLLTELNRSAPARFRGAGRIARRPVATTEDLLHTVASVDYVVTCRFHGVVFAQLLNKPVMALSHHPKVAVLMSDFGLSEYCLDIRKCDVQQMKETFARLVANREMLQAAMAAKTAEYRQALADQFEVLFNPVRYPGRLAHRMLEPAGTGESGR